MKVQILVSTMNQFDYSLLEKLGLQSDAVVVNQCGRNGRTKLNYNGYEVIWIDSEDRGLSKSRNLALQNASADICILCDDDEHLNMGYPSMVIDSYCALPKADFIAFNIDRIGWNEKERLFEKPRAIGFFKTYGSVHVTFRRESVLNHNIRFNEQFGAGSGMYSCAEDSIFCMDIHKAGLKMYTYPGVLGSVTCEQSTWFTGYSESYFYDTGAFLAAVFPKLKHLLKWYYPIRCRKISTIPAKKIIGALNKGICGYKRGLNYTQYCDSIRK